jgi:hypothetical protein
MTKKHEIKVDLYKVIREAVENGIAYGWARAHKHTDAPDEHTIKTAIEDAVMNELCEVITFDD